MGRYILFCSGNSLQQWLEVTTGNIKWYKFSGTCISTSFFWKEIRAESLTLSSYPTLLHSSMPWQPPPLHPLLWIPKVFKVFNVYWFHKAPGIYYVWDWHAKGLAILHCLIFWNLSFVWIWKSSFLLAVHWSRHWPFSVCIYLRWFNNEKDQ